MTPLGFLLCLPQQLLEPRMSPAVASVLLEFKFKAKNVLFWLSLQITAFLFHVTLEESLRKEIH